MDYLRGGGFGTVTAKRGGTGLSGLLPPGGAVTGRQLLRPPGRRSRGAADFDGPASTTGASAFTNSGRFPVSRLDRLSLRAFQGNLRDGVTPSAQVSRRANACLETRGSISSNSMAGRGRSVPREAILLQTIQIVNRGQDRSLLRSSPCEPILVAIGDGSGSAGGRGTNRGRRSARGSGRVASQAMSSARPEMVGETAGASNRSERLNGCVRTVSASGANGSAATGQMVRKSAALFQGLSMSKLE